MFHALGAFFSRSHRSLAVLLFLFLSASFFLYSSHWPSRRSLIPALAPQRPSKHAEKVESSPWLENVALRRQGVIDVYPPVPQWSELEPDHFENTKYLSYLPNSGYHNQRIEMENALMLSRLLNRTLLLPNFRLGSPVSWKPKAVLQAYLAREQKSSLLECKDLVQTLERTPRERRFGPCQNYTEYTEVSPAFLMNPDNLANFSILHRTDMSRDYFFSPQGLGLSESQVYSYNDSSRYDYVFYESASVKSPLGRYSRRANIEEMAFPPISDAVVLDLGSMFGTGRLKLRSPEAMNISQEARNAMVFHIDPLEQAFKAVVQLLGGSGNFVGLHLRIGDGIFRSQRKNNMARVFKVLLKNLGVTPHGLEVSLKKLEKPSNKGSKSSKQLTAGKLSSKLKCRKPLYTDPTLQSLNTPIYIATDARYPQADPTLDAFYNTFPCVFSYGDFVNVAGISSISKLRSEQDGTRLGPFLIPFFDSMIAASGRLTFGTPGSTFSGFTTKILHPAFSVIAEAEKDELDVFEDWGS